MFYYLFKWLDKVKDVPGTGIFQFISVRAAMAAIFAVLISMIFGKYVIAFLKKHQIGEIIRTDGPESHFSKQGTPTMGGVIIIAGIIVPVLLWGKLENSFIIMMLVSTLFMGVIGFLDDYIKFRQKRNLPLKYFGFISAKRGIKGRVKVIGQIGLGLMIGATLYYNPNFKDEIRTITTTPFLKNNEFDYADLIRFVGTDYRKYAFLVFIPIIIFIVTAITNSVNLTDGIDGLAAGTSAIVGTTLGVFAYISGNTFMAKYLGITYIPNSGEIVVYIAAFVGACVGFLWYNTYPAQVFMGDTGSLALGGGIAAVVICLKKELLVPVLCGVFFVESLSVVIQVSYFKYTKKKYGEGRRIFRMSPLHHHYEKAGMPEPKIVFRFWVITLFCCILAVLLLKLK